MAIDLTTVPNPLFTEQVRSARELVRRMLLLRWTTGKYLDAVPGNYGVKRPLLGFSNEDVFRAASQVLMADYKAIGNAFFQLIEIFLGPYEDLYYQILENKAAGSPYISIKPFGDYVEYQSLVGSFSANERITATHPIVDLVVEAQFKHIDTSANRLYFTDIYSIPDGFVFQPGVEIIGQTSGAKVTPTAEAVIVSLERMPIYAQAKIYSPGTDIFDPSDPGATNLEEKALISRSPFIQRVRLNEVLSSSHVADEMIKIEGGCWDFIESQSRRVKVRVLCEQKRENRLPGNSYIHHKPYLEAKLRTRLVATDTEIFIDDFITDEIDLLSYPRKIIIDPEGKRTRYEGGSLLADVTAFDTTARKFTLSAAIPAGRNWPIGTTVRWYQAPSGLTTAPTTITDTYIMVQCNVVDPVGVWVIDRAGGGVGPQNVFVTKTTFQTRGLITELVNGVSTTLRPDRSFGEIDLTVVDRLEVVSESGSLGTVQISSIAADGEITLTAPPVFSTSIYDERTILMLQNAGGANRLELSRAIGVVHAATQTFDMLYGTSSVQPTYTDHLAAAGWPPGVSPTEKWPGPYVFEPSKEAPINEDADGAAIAYIDRTGIIDPTQADARIWLGLTAISTKFDPSTAATYPEPSPKIIPPPGDIYKVPVSDGSLFPTTAIVQQWRTSPLNNIPGQQYYPTRVVVGSEGTFGRPALLYWGKESISPGSKESYLYISGIQRIHLSGARVAAYVERLPVKGISGVFEVSASNPNFKLENGDALLDHGTSEEEAFEYDSIEIFSKNPTGDDRAILIFERGFIPQYAHNPNRTNPEISSDIMGVKIVRADTIAVPRTDGYSFPMIIGGNVALMRLKVMLELVRAAGVQVELYDENDQLILF